jgi:hypothetical protein
MPDDRVDPIRYGWERCNRGVPFPKVLGKGFGFLSLAADPFNATTMTLAQAVAGDAEVRRVLNSFITREHPKL